MTEHNGDDATLYTRLCALFATDPLIDEIGLVFGIDAADVTVDNAFVLEAHKLGVAFAAGPTLFKQATTHFYALNPLLIALAKHETQSDGIEVWRPQLLDSTRAILLINADFYTAWNTRKEFVRRGWLDALDELRFCDLVFTLHPKSIDTWAYRRWLAARVVVSFQQPQDDDLSGLEAFDAFYVQQIEVCERLAEQKARNYHAWSYRHWVVSQCAHDDETRLTRELERMRIWCESHITDHSGWNHRQHVVKLMLHVSKAKHHSVNDVRRLVVAEYELLSKIMALYPTHEALWCHRRFVVQLVLKEVLRSDKLDIVALMQALHGWDEKVKSFGAASVPTGESTGELLATGWRCNGESIATESSESLVLAIVHEMELAWSRGNCFARRFALWCLERLRVISKASGSSQSSLTEALESLGDTLRERLCTDDSLLEDLWTSQSQHSH
uniref:Protein prenyltransferase alpha subunit repeat-containing protein 1 n=1 Tax=Globisporangium ultimum (strain ATCC 200006 / CBS 805.95 / DAOM BR144) TaxID=431595 RepID=K3X844_GLOUD